MLSDHAKGALLVAGAALCWSSGGILLRLVESASGFAMVFWRSAFMAMAVLLWLLVRYQRGTAAAVRAVGWPGCLSALLLSGAFIGYVLSINETAVANTLVIMSASPLIAALLAWLLIGERLSARALLAIVVAFGGIALMFGDELGRGRELGNALAMMVAVCFGGNIVLLRRFRSIDMVPVMLLAGIVSALLALPFADAFTVPARDVAILAVMGCFQLALGLFLFIRGTPYLRAAELGLISLLETVCAPLWVWLGVGEEPSAMALVGGSLVLMAVAGQAVAGRSDELCPAPPAAQGSSAPAGASASSSASGGDSSPGAAVSGQTSGSLTRQ